MKYSVTTYSFSQLIRSGKETQLSVIQIAKDLGFDGIEFTPLTPEEGYTEEEYAVKLREEAKRVGIDIVSYTVGANLLTGDVDKEVENVKHMIDIAEILGAPTLRHDVAYVYPEGQPQDFYLYVDQIADRAREITEYAAKKGIKTCTENHGYIAQAPDRVEKLINTVNHPNYGWLVDIGNFMCVNADCLESVKIGAKYAFHVHAKDFVLSDNGFATSNGTKIQGTIVGNGVVPVKDCIDVLKESGYNNYITVEFEGPEECLSAIKQGLEFLKKCE